MRAAHRTFQIPEPRRTIYQTAFLCAAVYNIVIGLLLMLLPHAALYLHAIPREQVNAVGVAFWQGEGMFILLFGLIYAYARRDPERYAPMVFIGAIGKVLSPLGFLMAYWQGVLPGKMIWMVLVNDVIWWPVLFAFVFETVVQRRYEPR